MIAHERYDGPMMTRSKLPDMKISDQVALLFDGRADFFGQIFV